MSRGTSIGTSVATSTGIGTSVATSAGIGSSVDTSAGIGTSSAHRHRQRGATLVVAVFLLVVLAALGAFAVRLTLMQQQTVSSSLLATQAFHAARSGIAWGAHRALNGGWCGATTLALTEAGTAGFSVAVSCTQSTHAEGGATIDVFVIEALAEWGAYGEADYVSRRLEAKITNES